MTDQPSLPLGEGLSIRLPRLARPHRQPQDTVAGCRDRASADLAEAEGMDTAHGRTRLEHSAASWTKRGDLLQRLEDSFQARTAR